MAREMGIAALLASLSSLACSGARGRVCFAVLLASACGSATGLDCCFFGNRYMGAHPKRQMTTTTGLDCSTRRLSAEAATRESEHTWPVARKPKRWNSVARARARVGGSGERHGLLEFWVVCRRFSMLRSAAQRPGPAPRCTALGHVCILPWRSRSPMRGGGACTCTSGPFFWVARR